MRRRFVLVLTVLILTPTASAFAAPLERDRGGFDWFLERLEPLLASVLPQSAGPDADPNGATQPPPPSDPENEGDAGPDADPNG